MSMLFKIHPAIGVARLGDSTSEFCITPESTGALPIECDHEGRTTLGPDGTEQRVSTFKDRSGAIKRQAARFRVYVSSAENNLPAHELTLGEIIEVTDKFSGRRIRGEVVDIHWTVYLANKKASFYEFHQLQGEYGYDADHPLRNADITGDGPRRRLIIDPGPQTVSGASDSARRAFFSRQENASVPQTFPPHLQPFSIDTLGALLVSQQNGQARLLVLGGHGRSGSMRTGFGEPKISSYANNDGWFDDTSDGPVTAQLEINVLEVNGHPPQPSVQHVMFPVQSAAWVVVAYPRYAPQITDVVTMDDTIFDTAVRNLAFRPEIFGVPPFDRNDPANRPASDEDLGRWRRAAQWNPAYYPRFWRDIWPILERPDRYKWVMDFDPFTGSDPHNPTPGAGGLFDPQYISQPPNDRQDPKAREASRQRRQAIYETLRGSGQENIYQLPRTQLRPHEGPIGMPDLCGDNPMTNIAASKFLRLSETTLFFMRQWVDGRFIDERAEGFDIPDRGSPPGEALDRGVLSNVLVGTYCTGSETCWILRNPGIYQEPYRIRHRAGVTPGSLSLDVNLSAGMEPGDITRYSSVPWQSDFNECSSQDIDITYTSWNQTDPAGIGSPAHKVIQTLYWWPAHRPMQVFVLAPEQPGAPVVPLSTAGSAVLTNTIQLSWSRDIPQSYRGDLQMVTAWKELGFITENTHAQPGAPAFIETERNGS